MLELSQVDFYSSSKQHHFEKVYQHKKTDGEYCIILYMTEIMLTYTLQHYHSLKYIPNNELSFDFNTKGTRESKYFRATLHIINPTLHIINQINLREIIYKEDQILMSNLGNNKTWPPNIRMN